MSDCPPRLAEAVLVKLIGRPDVEAIAGDLRESFAARGGGAAWYWGQVASCVLVRLSPSRRLLPDLHYGLRIVRRNPGYAAAAMICLALGIGVNTTVFSWLDEMYFRRLPVPEADRIVSVDRAGRPPITWREFRDMGVLESMSGIAAAIPKGTFLDVERVNDQIYAEAVSTNYFDVLRVSVALGRSLQAADDNADRVAVLSHSAWARLFHGDPLAIGQSIRIEDQWYRIVGIAPAGFRGVSAPLAIDAWMPISTYPEFRAQSPGVPVFGRLAAGQTLAGAAAEWATVDGRLAKRKSPLTVRAAAGYTWTEMRRGLIPIAGLLSAVVGTVLFIACVNVAILLLSRAAVRRREMAIRRALGASRGQLIRQGITEGFILSAGGAALGLLLGYWTNRALAAGLPMAHPEIALHTVYLDVNWRVAAVIAGMAFVCTLLFSIWPALVSAHGEAAVRARHRGFLVVAQVSLSLVLLIGAGLLIRALAEAQGTSPGFATGNRVYLRLFTPDNNFTPAQATALYSRLLESARSLPGVREATLSFAVFGFQDGDCATALAAEAPRKVNINVVEPNYFAFQRIPILRGRTFTTADRPESPRVIVVNETMARQWWPGENPIGKTAWLGCKPGSQTAAQVAGVVADSKYGSLDEAPLPVYFAHWRQVWWNGFFALMLHTSGEPQAMAEPLRKLAQTGGANLRIYEFRSFGEAIDLTLVRAKWQAFLLSVFSLLAMMLAAIGLYGVVAYAAASRSHEIGVRMALGARADDVRRMVLEEGLRLALAGIAIGLLLSAGLTRFLRHFLFGAGPLDPLTFAASALAWIVIAMLASYVPARRAMRVDPVVALRYD